MPPTRLSWVWTVVVVLMNCVTDWVRRTGSVMNTCFVQPIDVCRRPVHAYEPLAEMVRRAWVRLSNSAVNVVLMSLVGMARTASWTGEKLLAAAAAIGDPVKLVEYRGSYCAAS